MSKTTKLTMKETKRAVDKFLNETSKPITFERDSISYEYQVGFYSAGRGIYSGVSKIRHLERFGEVENFRYYGFNINLVTNEVYIEGISGKPLRVNSTVYQNTFGYGHAFDAGVSNISYQDSKMFKAIGLKYGKRSPLEAINVGRGIERFISEAPIAEKFYKEIDGLIIPFTAAVAISKYVKQEG